MRVEVFDGPEELAQRAADIVRDVVKRKPACVLALPSGTTPIALYRELARRVAAGEFDLSAASAFGIDEFYGVPRTHAGTNTSYFLEHTGALWLAKLHIMDSDAVAAEVECARFTRAIDAAGGLDVAVLGIGVNGHIAFNEPGSAFDSRARVVELAEPSRAAYASAFGGIDRVPARGLTLGIADLMAARQVILLASGSSKALVVARAIEGPLTEEVPASAVQRHENAIALLDREAASMLQVHSAE